jgi:adenylosuccinate lyase
MSRIEANEEQIKQELNEHWEVISEAAQTILRAAGQSNAYESLKAQTHGRVLSEASYRHWVESLDIDQETRTRLANLSPESYIGLAVELVDEATRS